MASKARQTNQSGAEQEQGARLRNGAGGTVGQQAVRKNWAWALDYVERHVVAVVNHRKVLAAVDGGAGNFRECRCAVRSEIHDVESRSQGRHKTVQQSQIERPVQGGRT